MANIENALVVGGGIAGMACAIQLRKAAIHVDLAEIDPGWRMYGAGITITGPTLRALRTLGVLDEVKALGAAWNGAKVFNQAGELIEELSIPPLAPDLPGTAGIMRPVLHRILSTQTRAVGASVRLGVTVSQLIEQVDGVKVVFTDGSEAHYDLIVGADGIFSNMRERLFPHAPKPRFTGQVIYRIVAEQPAGFDRSHFFMGREVKIGFNPVSPTHMYMFLLHADPTNPWLDPQEMPQRLYDKMEGFGGFVPQIRETVLTTAAHTLNYKALDVHLLPLPWHSGRVLLIGDAAHSTTPHLASGAGMAMEDGIVLVDEIEKGGTLDEIFARFMARRFGRCRHVIENSVKLGQIEMSHGSVEEHGRLMADSLRILREPI